jgi:hypothetical protein
MTTQKTNQPIETLLSETMPQPAAAFEQRLEARLLARLEQKADVTHKDNETMLKRRLSRMQQAFAIAAAVTLMFAVVMTVPPLRSFAQDIIGDIFIQGEDDVLEPSDYYPPVVMMSGPANLGQEHVDFEIIQFSTLLDNFRPRTTYFISYDERMIATSADITVVEKKYLNPRTDALMALVYVEGYTASAEWQEHGGKLVGASAEIETVSIGNVTGQYLRGIWRYDQSQQLMVWDNDHPRQIIAWWQDEVIVAIVTQSDDLTQDDLIAAAEAVWAGYGNPPSLRDVVFTHSDDNTQSIDDINAILSYELALNNFNEWLAGEHLSTMRDAQERVDFTIYQPAILPDDLELFDVTVLYALPPQLYKLLPYGESANETTIYQRYFSDYSAHELLIQQQTVNVESGTFTGVEVGGSAVIEILQIGGVEVEYVRGAWRYVESIDSVQWSNTVAEQRISWWQDGSLITLIETWRSDSNLLQQEGILAMAESIIVQAQDTTPPEGVTDLFRRSESDEYTVTFQPPAERPESPFGLTVEEAETFVEFDVVEFSYDLQQTTEYVLMEVFHESLDVIHLRYQYRTYVQQHLFFSQQRREDYEVDGFMRVPIGESAEVETVQIGDITGQYLEGRWEPPSQDAIPDPNDDGSVELNFLWNPDLPTHRFIWEQNGMVYGLTTYGYEHLMLERDEIIAIATALIAQMNDD